MPPKVGKKKPRKSAATADELVTPRADVALLPAATPETPRIGSALSPAPNGATPPHGDGTAAASSVAAEVEAALIAQIQLLEGRVSAASADSSRWKAEAQRLSAAGAEAATGAKDAARAARAELAQASAAGAAQEAERAKAERKLKKQLAATSKLAQTAAPLEARVAELVQGEGELKAALEEAEVRQTAAEAGASAAQAEAGVVAAAVASLRAGNGSGELLRASKSGRRAMVALARAEKQLGLSEKTTYPFPTARSPGALSDIARLIIRRVQRADGGLGLADEPAERSLDCDCRPRGEHGRGTRC